MNAFRIAWTPLVGLVVVTAAQVVNLVVGPQPWAGELLLSTSWAWTALFLACPVLVTVAGLDGARLFPSARDTVWNQPSLRRAALTRVWAAGTVSSTLPLLGVQAWMMLAATPTSTEVALSALWLTAAGVGTVAGVIGLGLALGALLGRTAGTVVAFAAGLVLAFLQYGSSAPVLMLGGASDSLLGLRVSPTAALAQACGLLLLLAATTFVLLTRTGPGAPSATRFALAVLGAAAVSIGLISWASPLQYETVAQPDDGLGCVELSPEGRTTGHGTLCTYGEHRRVHPDLRDLWGAMSTAAVRSGVTRLPAVVREASPAVEPSAFTEGPPGSVSAFTLTKDQLDQAADGPTVTPQWLAWQITTPVWCPALWAEEAPDESLFRGQEAAAAALVAFAEGDGDAETARVFDEAWESLSRCGADA